LTYLAGVLGGTVFGLAVGLAKYLLIWRPIQRSNKSLNLGAVYWRVGVSNVINVITLLIVFLLRSHLPFDMNYITTLAAVAIALSLMGRLCPLTSLAIQDGKKEGDNQ